MSGTGTGNGCDVLSKVMRSRWLRRGLDVAGAALIPVGVGAPMGLIARAGGVTLGRPIREERVGLHAAPFRIVKFRSLRAPGWGAIPGRPGAGGRVKFACRYGGS